MSSQVDIANRALTKLGESRITSLEDNTNNARVINSMFTIVRDAELRAYQYQLPSDCLRLIGLDAYVALGMGDYITRTDSLYALEGNKVLTDLNAPLNIRYVKIEEDTNQYTSDFAEAFACRLAAECAETLTNSTSKRQLAWQEYKEAISLALKSNSLELPSQSRYDDSWILSRL
jgi:hypothetical protein